MPIFGNIKGSIISEPFSIEHDLGQLKKGNAVEVALYEDHLELSAPFLNKQAISLQYSQITDVFYGGEQEIIEKEKSVIGRAAAGGLLFGGFGLVVGAISGTGKKNKHVTKLKLIISYKTSTGEDAFLQFEDTRVYKGPKVAKKLKELCGIQKEIITSL